jgi:hypothetical protein
MLILYTTLLKVSISSKSFWWNTLGLFSIRIIWLLLSLFESLLFLSISLLLWLGILGTQWVKSIWKMDTFISLFWSMFILFLVFLEFYHESMLSYVKAFFCIYGNDHVIFFFHSVYVLYYIYWFDLLFNYTCIPGMKWTWAWYVIFLLWCWILLASFY